MQIMIYARAFSEGLRPDPQLKVSEWANEYRVLAPTAASDLESIVGQRVNGIV
ncbi:terminase large subunit [Wolbachia phage WO]|nr:terminase large subunit [Wolbachia phage WO]